MLLKQVKQYTNIEKQFYLGVPLPVDSMDDAVAFLVPVVLDPKGKARTTREMRVPDPTHVEVVVVYNGIRTVEEYREEGGDYAEVILDYLHDNSDTAEHLALAELPTVDMEQWYDFVKYFPAQTT